MAAVTAVVAVLAVAALLALVFVGVSNPGHLLSPGAAHHRAGAARHATGATAPKGTSRATTPSPAPAGAARPVSTTGVTTPSLQVAQTKWQLAAPVGDETALTVPGAPSELELLGGVTTGGRRADGVFVVNLTTGSLTLVGDLQSPLADAAGAVVGGRGLVAGGGTPAPQASVQGLPATALAPAGRRAGATTTVVGTLPSPRLGATAVTVGTVTYLVGGQDGAAAQPAVLATGDGHTFTTVATLPDPVAFPAVAAVGTDLYVFGGTALDGPSAGRPTATVQRVDPLTGRVTEVGQLPEPVAGASAVVLADQVYVLGGDASGTIWAATPAATDGARVAVRAVGTLPVPVSHAGVAVVGDTAWVVGGESAGAPVSAVQTVTSAPAP